MRITRFKRPETHPAKTVWDVGVAALAIGFCSALFAGAHLASIPSPDSADCALVEGRTSFCVSETVAGPDGATTIGDIVLSGLVMVAGVTLMADEAARRREEMMRGWPSPRGLDRAIAQMLDRGGETKPPQA